MEFIIKIDKTSKANVEVKYPNLKKSKKKTKANKIDEQ